MEFRLLPLLLTHLIGQSASATPRMSVVAEFLPYFTVRKTKEVSLMKGASCGRSLLAKITHNMSLVGELLSAERSGERANPA
jgi:hypothetical protein